MMICSMISLGLELQTDNWNEEELPIVVFFGAEKSFNELAAFAAEHEVKAVYCPFDT